MIELTAYQLDEIRHKQRMDEHDKRLAKWMEPVHDASPFLNKKDISDAVKHSQVEIAVEHAKSLRRPKVSKKTLP